MCVQPQTFCTNVPVKFRVLTHSLHEDKDGIKQRQKGYKLTVKGFSMENKLTARARGGVNHCFFSLLTQGAFFFIAGYRFTSLNSQTWKESTRAVGLCWTVPPHHKPVQVRYLLEVARSQSLPRREKTMKGLWVTKLLYARQLHQD